MRKSLCTSKNVLQLYLIDALDDDKTSVYLFSFHFYQSYLLLWNWPVMRSSLNMPYLTIISFIDL